MDTVLISPEQMDLLLMWMLSLSCSVAFCLGFLANEIGAK